MAKQMWDEVCIGLRKDAQENSNSLILKTVDGLSLPFDLSICVILG